MACVRSRAMLALTVRYWGRGTYLDWGRPPQRVGQGGAHKVGVDRLILKEDPPDRAGCHFPETQSFRDSLFRRI